MRQSSECRCQCCWHRCSAPETGRGAGGEVSGGPVATVAEFPCRNRKHNPLLFECCSQKGGPARKCDNCWARTDQSATRESATCGLRDHGCARGHPCRRGEAPLSALALFCLDNGCTPSSFPGNSPPPPRAKTSFRESPVVLHLLVDITPQLNTLARWSTALALVLVFVVVGLRASRPSRSFSQLIKRWRPFFGAIRVFVSWLLLLLPGLAVIFFRCVSCVRTLDDGCSGSDRCVPRGK